MVAHGKGVDSVGVYLLHEEALCKKVNRISGVVWQKVANMEDSWSFIQDIQKKPENKHPDSQDGLTTSGMWQLSGEPWIVLGCTAARWLLPQKSVEYPELASKVKRTEEEG